MVVVWLGRDFVPGGLAGQFDGAKPLFFMEFLDGSVDGGDAKRGKPAAATLENLLGGKRPAGAFKHFPDYFPLCGVSLHSRPARPY